MSCPSLETAAAWVLGDAAEGADPGVLERFEEHYFACDVCLARVERLQHLVEVFRATVPILLTSERRRDLEALRPGMPAIHVLPGERALLRLSPETDVGLWVLHAPLERATRVDFEAHDGEGARMFSLADVPFDAARGEVVLPCQWHLRVLGAGEMRVRLTITGTGGERPVSEYILDHAFESS